MNKNDKRGTMKQLFANPAMIKIAAVILVAVIAVVGIFAFVASSSKDAESQVVSVEQETDEKAQEKQDAANQAEDAQEPAQEEAANEEAAEEVDYAAVFVVTINPKLKIYVDWDNVVVKMETMNADAETLIADFEWENKKLADCFESLLSEAHEKGFLKDNAKVSIEVEDSKDVDTSSMIQKMENAAQVVCVEKDINIKWIADNGNVEESMDKVIEGKRAKTNTILPTDREQTEAEETMADTATQDKPQDNKKPESGSSNSGNNNSGNNGGNSGSNTPTTPDTPATPDETDEYSLVWEDNFEGTELNRADWNVELRKKGWVNEEWQEYVDKEENIYIEDGKLVLRPVKTVNSDGTASYTSGRVNTQNKHNFTYGKFEVSAKVPEGKGYLPAFWLMAADENVYGQWPRCGEIDIMEVMGQSTNKLHGTIHYGHNSSNGHKESQGTYILNSGSFSDEFHTFSCEWEPGKITWYVDGIKYHEESDWYTAMPDGTGELTYPAPFDQPFYIILNLAVGGSWVGYPDETTDFENQTYEIDYVRVYQKDSYDENVTKPEAEDVVIREPDVNGNYLINGDFEEVEDLEEAINWQFKTASTGVGSTTITTGKNGVSAISGNSAIIETSNCGDLDYSIQLLQNSVPLKAGATYELSFDAYATAERKLKVNSKAPDNGWYAYLDETVTLTTEKETYTYKFDMIHKDDANCTVEFNMGNFASTDTIVIDNVSLKIVSEDEDIRDSIMDPDKAVRADGNYIYNGEFKEGDGHLGYWDISNGADVSVTSLEDGRRLKVVVPNNGSVTLSQTNVPVLPNEDYVLSFETVVPSTGSINVNFDGADYTVISGTNGSWDQKFTTSDSTAKKDITITFNGAGIYYLDNVRIDEDALIKNGSFNAGFSGYDPYVLTGDLATYNVDSMTNDNAAAFDINTTGDAAWKIQLKQNGVDLEKDQWYKLSLDAKSTINRKLMFAIQRDGTNDDVWTPYSGEEKVDLTSEWQTFELPFQMTNATDLESVLSISMGAVDGIVIDEKHSVYIDNIVLEKIDEPEMDDVVVGQNMLVNPEFADNGEPWNKSIAVPAAGNITFGDGAITYALTNVGTEDWHAQLIQMGLQLENGQTYRVSFKAKSTESRTIKANVMSASYAWYGGSDITLEKDVEKDVSFDVTMGVTDTNGGLYLSLGQIYKNEIYDSTGKLISRDTVDTPASTITLSDFSIVKVGGDSTDTPSTPDVPEVEAGTEMITNGNFADGGTGWAYRGDCNFVNENAQFDIQEKTEGNPWDVQLTSAGMMLEEDTIYQLKFDITSTVSRKVTYGFADSGNGYSPCSGTETLELSADEKVSVNKDITMTAGANGTGVFQINLGFLGETIPTSKVIIDNISLVKLAKEDNPSAPEGEASTNLISDGNFDSDLGAWNFNKGADENSCNVTDGKAVLNVENLKDNVWDVQLTHSGLSLEKDVTYKVTFDIISTKARTIRCAFVDEANGYTECCDGQDIILEENNEVKVEKYFDMKSSSEEGKGVFQINVGNYGDNAQASIITIDNVCIIKVDNESGDETPGDNEETFNSGMIENGDFANGFKGWASHINEAASGNDSVTDGKAVFVINNVGTDGWHVHLKQSGLTLENGATYNISFDIMSDTGRTVKYVLQDPADYSRWYTAEDLVLAANDIKKVNNTFTVSAVTSEAIEFQLEMGNVGENPQPATITIDNVCLIKVSDAPEETPALMMLRRPSVDTLVEEETVEETIEETTSEEETTEEITSEEESSEETTTEAESTEEQTTEETTTEDESTEETTTEEESTEETTTEESSEDPTQEPSEEDAIVETKSEEEEEVEE